jgi:hypothetical protein
VFNGGYKMKIKLSVFLACIVLLVFSFQSCGGEAVPSPENSFKAFVAAVGADDAAKAEALCTPGYWKSERDSGERLFKQAVRKEFEMKKIDVKTKGERAVVTTDIVVKGKVVDRIYMYAVSEKGNWLFDGANENENQIGYFLDGRLTGSFHPSDYEGSKELEELGAKLIAMAGPLNETTDPAEQAGLIKEVLTGDPASIRSDLRLLLEVAQNNLKVVATHMVDPISRGAIVIYDETGKDKIFIYVAKEADGWRLIRCYTGWLSAEAILR